MYSALRVFFTLYLRLFHRLEIRGRQRIPATGPVILCANHSSYFDSMLLGLCTPRPVRFLIFRDFYRHPLLGWFVRACGAIPVSQNGADKEAMKLALAALARGEIIGIFPEGRLSRTGLPGTPKAGIGFLAAVSGAVIVPVTIAGAFYAYPRGRRIPRPASISVTVQQPVTVDVSRRRERGYVDSIAEDVMATIGRRVRRHFRQKFRRRKPVEG